MLSTFSLIIKFCISQRSLNIHIIPRCFISIHSFPYIIIRRKISANFISNWINSSLDELRQCLCIHPSTRTHNKKAYLCLTFPLEAMRRTFSTITIFLSFFECVKIGSWSKAIHSSNNRRNCSITSHIFNYHCFSCTTIAWVYCFFSN